MNFDRQEAFNKALFGVRAQGGPSMREQPGDGYPQCAYRGPDGCKCGVGHLIPDEKYEDRFEGKPAWEGAIMEAVGLHSTDDPAFLQALQKAHDEAALGMRKNFISNFNAGMVKVADKYGLEYTE
jgi:hypothetical protein